MASGTRTLRDLPLTGIVAATAAAIAVVLPLVAVWLQAEGLAAIGPRDRAALIFTLWQAALSAALSVVLAIPVARAVARREFPGRGALVLLFGAPFLLPVIVAVMGIVTVFGRNGPVNAVLDVAGLPEFQLYGAQGVILAHVFFNLPLAVRLILQGWSAIPGERFRLAASLNLGPREIARFLERPMLREVLPSAFLAIFLVCLTSFAVALTLGGGPRATTVELAIYQAFRFEFDIGRAAALGLLQFTLCAASAVVLLALTRPPGFGAGLDRPVERWDAKGPAARIGDAFVIGLAALFLVLPMAAVIARGVQGLGDLPVSVWAALLRSILMALGSTVLTTVIGLAIATAAARSGRKRALALEFGGTLSLAMSPLVAGTGLFLLLRQAGDPAVLALPVTVLVNALSALPFALRSLIPAARACERNYGRLADSLGMTGPGRLRLLTLPRLRGPLGFAAGLTAALSMGDLGVIALFSDPARATLPMQVYQLMGSYRTEAASGAALVLVLASFGLFWAFDRWGRGHA